jgi:hypothetical protein
MATQTATEDIAVAANLRVYEPNITDNLTGDITVAASIYVVNAPTEGETNAAIYVASGVIIEPQDTAKFVADLYDICGDIRFLWMPSLSGTTATDKSRHGATVTYSKEISTWDTTPSSLGRGITADFDGTDEQADTPHNARLSFGDGANDEPFSMLVLMNPDAINADYGLLNKEVGSTREYLLRQTSTGKLLFHLWDESTNGAIIRTGTVNQSADTWALVGTTYDGSALASGMTIWKNGAVTASTATEDATYTAMEAANIVVSVGCLGDPAWFYNGEMAFALITAKELNADEQWAVKELVNAFYDLTL